MYSPLCELRSVGHPAQQTSSLRRAVRALCWPCAQQTSSLRRARGLGIITGSRSSPALSGTRRFTRGGVRSAVFFPTATLLTLLRGGAGTRVLFTSVVCFFPLFSRGVGASDATPRRVGVDGVEGVATAGGRPRCSCCCWYCCMCLRGANVIRCGGVGP